MDLLTTFQITPTLLPFITGTGKVSLPASKLHLLIPASHPEVNLCKVLLSAAILGYPSPVIVNWNRSFHDPKLVDGGAHLAKIFGVNEYLSGLNSSYDEDLVLMVDGYDVWLQLQPQVLISRYLDMNRRADRRIRDELGNAAETYGVRQEIVFGCQKRCWPWKANDPPCYAVPESMLPEDIYGRRTDKLNSDRTDPYIYYRPRFLNSGVGLGTVRAMRKLFRQAFELSKHERNFGSDQYIFSHIFGDQEVWREVARRDGLRNDSLATTSHNDKRAHDRFDPKHLAKVRAKAAGQRDGTFEFGIGVDYGSEIVLNTVFAEDDTDWLVFSNHSQLEEVQRHRNIQDEHQRSNELSADIATAPLPFSSLTEDDELRSTEWEDVSLFTDVWTGITPAVIHNNAHRDGLKSLRETSWPRIWFHTHARALLRAYIDAPVAAVAVSEDDDGSTQREWWPTETKKGGARNGLSGLGSDGDGWIPFDDMCKEHQAELFRGRKEK